MTISRPAALVAGIALALVIAAVAAVAATGLLTGGEAPSPRNKAEAAAEEFLDTYLDPQGRVVRRDQGADTVSEGQAYAMLLSVATGDHDRFDAAWTWAQENLQGNDGLLAFRWSDGDVVDGNAATDAELDAVRALVLAAEQFDEPRYLRDAERLAEAMERHLVVELEARPVLMPGAWADDDAGTIVNPSYYSPRSFAHLDELRPAGRWSAVDDTARALVEELTDRDRLPPDWARVSEDGVRPLNGASDDEGEPQYSYDAVRLPVRYAESCQAEDRAVAAELWPLLESNPAASVRGLQGEDLGRERHAAALVGAAAAAAAAGERDRASQLLDDATALDDQRPTYYGSAWIALGRVLLETDLLGRC